MSERVIAIDPVEWWVNEFKKAAGDVLLRAQAADGPHLSAADYLKVKEALFGKRSNFWERKVDSWIGTAYAEREGGNG